MQVCSWVFILCSCTRVCVGQIKCVVQMLYVQVWCRTPHIRTYIYAWYGCGCKHEWYVYTFNTLCRIYLWTHYPSTDFITTACFAYCHCIIITKLCTLCCREIAKIIIEQEKWKKSLKNGTTAENGFENTPFRRLVRLMPGTVIFAAQWNLSLVCLCIRPVAVVEN